MNDDAIIESVNAKLSADDWEGAYDVLQSLKKDNLFLVGYRIIGHTGYGQTKTSYLALLRRTLPQLMASTQLARDWERRLFKVARDHQRSSEHLARAKRFLIDGRINADSLAFTSGGGQFLTDRIKELEAEFVRIAEERQVPIPTDLRERFPDLSTKSFPQTT